VAAVHEVLGSPALETPVNCTWLHQVTNDCCLTPTKALQLATDHSRWRLHVTAISATHHWWWWWTAMHAAQLTSPLYSDRSVKICSHDTLSCWTNFLTFSWLVYSW